MWKTPTLILVVLTLEGFHFNQDVNHVFEIFYLSFRQVILKQ